jgi:hypothetical protein
MRASIHRTQGGLPRGELDASLDIFLKIRDAHDVNR